MIAAGQDLRYASQMIQADLDRFQRQKVVDLKLMSLAFARMHREWAIKNLREWEAAKREIDRIELSAIKAPPFA
jgi:sorting nexin-41/42